MWQRQGAEIRFRFVHSAHTVWSEKRVKNWWNLFFLCAAEKFDFSKERRFLLRYVILIKNSDETPATRMAWIAIKNVNSYHQTALATRPFISSKNVGAWWYCMHAWVCLCSMWRDYRNEPNWIRLNSSRKRSTWISPNVPISGMIALVFELGHSRASNSLTCSIGMPSKRTKSCDVPLPHLRACNSRSVDRPNDPWLTNVNRQFRSKKVRQLNEIRKKRVIFGVKQNGFTEMGKRATLIWFVHKINITKKKKETHDK